MRKNNFIFTLDTITLIILIVALFMGLIESIVIYLVLLFRVIIRLLISEVKNSITIREGENK